MKASTLEEFQQLPAEVREYILDKHRDYETGYHGWWDGVHEQLVSDMEDVGVTANGMQFSGFWSQGDGACFSGSIYSWAKFLTQEKFSQFSDLLFGKDIGFSARWALSHRGYTPACYFERSLYEPEETDFAEPLRYQLALIDHRDIEARLDGLEKAIAEWVEERCSHLYKTLEEEYEYLTSDETVIDRLLANDLMQGAIDEAIAYLGLEEPDEQQAAA